MIAPHPLARLKFERVTRAGHRHDRRAGRRLQDRHGDARYFPRHRRRRGARLRPPRARRSAIARAQSRELFGGPLADLQMVQGSPRRHGARRRRRGAAGLSRRLGQGQRRRARHARGRDGEALRHRARAAASSTRRCSCTAATACAAATSSSGSIAKSARCASTKARPKCRKSSSHGKRFQEHDHGFAIARPLGPHRHLHPRQSAAAARNGRTFSLDGFDYPETLNAAVELTDRMVARGFGDHVALIGNGRRRTYKELSDWTNRIAHALVEDFGVKPGNRVLIRSANNPAMVACWLAATKAGAVVVNTMPMLRAGELAQDRRQGRGLAGAVRHAADGRARHLRQDREVPQAGDRLRRHRQSRRRARPHRAEQGGDASTRCRPGATTWRCSASPPAPPASRRRPCISIATC